MADTSPRTIRAERRGNARQRGYTARWERVRRLYLAEHPMCVMCERDGRITAAMVVDHIKPHKGDMALFWDAGNWQALCGSCHNSRKQSAERRGYEKGVDANGRPLDANHPWSRRHGGWPESHSVAPGDRRPPCKITESDFRTGDVAATVPCVRKT